MPKIEEEIKQKKFNSEYHKAHVNILFTASWLNSSLSSTLKPYNLSVQQFNVLRILRGAYPTPTSVKELTNRMLDKMSNASRLVEKLRQKGLVARTSSDVDRRRVDVIITEAGLSSINSASEIVEKQLDINLSALSVEQAQLLNNLLDDLRG